MSEFDEEAERERLREKYERDRQERAATQRMSDLLLKGATMTNAHCDECGSPFFRTDGEVFCPTCGTQNGDGEANASGDAEMGETATDAETAAAATDAETAAAGVEPGDADTEGAERADAAVAETSDQPGGRETDAPNAADASGPEPAGASGDGPARGAVERDGPAAGPSGDDGTPGDALGTGVAPGERPSPEPTDRTTARGGRERQPDATARDATASEAEQALVRALTRHARAADTDDPRLARDHLEAAREAAQALAALRR